MEQGMREVTAERGGTLEHFALLECLGFLSGMSREVGILEALPAEQTVLPNARKQKIQIMSLDIMCL